MSAIGPYVYFERECFMVHCWARYFRLPYHHGFKWRIMFRIGGRWFCWGTR